MRQRLSLATIEYGVLNDSTVLIKRQQLWDEIKMFHILNQAADCCEVIVVNTPSVSEEGGGGFQWVA